MVTLELRNQRVTLTPEQAERLRAAAVAHGSVSPRARDLALALEWALAYGTVKLRRVESDELLRLVNQRDLADIAERVRLSDGLGSRRRFTLLPSGL